MSKKGPASIIDDLRVAVRTEMTGHRFYTAAAEMVENERGKNVFVHLAKEELDHIRAIAAMVHALEEGKGWLGYDDAVKTGEGIFEKEGLPIFPEENEMLDKLKLDPGDLSAVKIAMESEEKAVDAYLEMLKRAETPDEKVFLTNLLEMEKDHLKVLRWESEALSQTGFWGDTMEFSVEKESD
ncbi:MAG: ferritin family protein [Thermodesulfobacteriota bacterium]